MVEAAPKRWERRLLRLRPEEWLFVILTVVLVGITINYGAGHKTLWKLIGNWRFVAIIGVMGVFIFLRGWYKHQELRGALHSVAMTVREFSPLWACIIIYETLHDLTPLIRPIPIDNHLIAIDHWLFGVDVSRWLNDHIGAALVTEIMVLCYTSYGLAIPTYAGYLFLKGRMRAFRDLSLGISVTAVLGYIGYITIPAVGPYLYQGGNDAIKDKFASDQPNVFPDPLPAWDGTPGVGLLDAINKLKGTATDCFPSLHTAMTTVLLVMMWRNGHKRGFWFYFPIACCLYVATLYLRVHYAIDVIAGFATAALVLYITPRINDWWIARREAAGYPDPDVDVVAAQDEDIEEHLQHAEHDPAKD